MTDNIALSAFGATYPSHDPGGERVRWFCPEQILGPEELQRVLEAVSEYRHRVQASRSTVRVVSRGPLSTVSEAVARNQGYGIEARVSLGEPDDWVISYVGRCEPSRRESAVDLRKERQLVERLKRTPRCGAAEIDRVTDRHENLWVEEVTGADLSGTDIERLVTMHDLAFPTFPYDFARKLELMLQAPEHYILVIGRSGPDGQIEAFSNIELVRPALTDGRSLFLAEYDNTMRMPDTSRLRDGPDKLGAAIRLKLARLARERGVDLCYGESRAGLVAINRISYDIGMTFAGTLERHLLISGECDIEYAHPSRFESLNVWYLNRQALARLGVSP